MNLTLQGHDYRYHPTKETNIVFKDVCADWDYFFDNLRQHRDYLKKRKGATDSIGKQISLQAQIDRLDRLFVKYVEFINACEEERYNDL